ncbi:MAG: hypothetical protein JNJ46_11070 [Myxococcales bacterium]|nr:hypothetical protein [Myxococcales bacterium]
MRRLTLAVFMLCSASCETIWSSRTTSNEGFKCYAAGSVCEKGTFCNVGSGKCEAPCGPESPCISCSTPEGAEMLVARLQQQSEQTPTVIRLTPNSTCTFSQANENDMGPSALPAIRSDVVIEGNDSTLIRAPGATPFRFFYVAPPPASGRKSQLTLRNLKLQGGLAQGGDGRLGAAFTQTGQGTSPAPGPGSGGGGAGLGGAIFTQGTLILENVTLTGNMAQGGSAPEIPDDAQLIKLSLSSVQTKAGGGGGGMGSSGAAAMSGSEGGGGGGFGPGVAEGARGGSGPYQTEGGSKDGWGGTTRNGPAEIHGTEPGSPAKMGTIGAGPGAGAGPMAETAWLAGSGGGCGALAAGGGSSHGGGGGAVLALPNKGDASPAGGGGGFYSNGGDGGNAGRGNHGGGGGAYGGGGGGGLNMPAGGGGGGVGGGGAGGVANPTAAYAGAGGGGGGGFAGGGGGGAGSLEFGKPEAVACSGGMGGFGGGGGVGTGLQGGAPSRFGGGSGNFVPGVAALAGGGMGAGGAIFALGGWVTVRNSTLSENSAKGGSGAVGGLGLGAGLFGVAAELTLEKATLTKNTVQSGVSRLPVLRDVTPRSRGAGLFALDPGAQAPITQTTASVDLVDCSITGNSADVLAASGVDAALEFAALAGGSPRGVLRDRGGTTGQIENGFAMDAPPTMTAGGCSMTDHSRGHVGAPLLLAFGIVGSWGLWGLLGIWQVRRGRTSVRRKSAG